MATPKKKAKKIYKGLEAAKKTSSARQKQVTKIAKSVKNPKGSALRAADELKKIKNRKYNY